MDLNLSNDASLIVLSGIVIFAAQRIISDIWIAPNLEFNKAMTKVERLLMKAEDLHRWTHGKNNSTSSTGKSMDQEIEDLRRELNVATWELIGAYRSLYFLERWWLGVRGVNVYAAKPSLLALSVLLCAPGDWDKAESKAKQKIDKANHHLKLTPVSWIQFIE
jgi:hypothetical protein